MKKLKLVALFFCFSFNPIFSQSEKPNIIIIYTDDQGYGDVSYMDPNSKLKTPNMDRIANEGISFTHGHSAGSACSPSRYALLTGRYSWRTKLKFGVGKGEDGAMIDKNRTTIASMLKNEGYNTACIGKWHVGMKMPGSISKRTFDWSQPIEDGPVDRGFDYWYGLPLSPKIICAWFENRGIAPGAKEPTMITYQKKNPTNIGPRWRIMKPYYNDLKEQPKETIFSDKFPTMVAPDWDDDQIITRYTDKAIEWISSKKKAAKSGKPFFLYFPMTSPHEPVAPRKDFIGKSPISGYGDFVMETDYQIGRILDTLDKLELAENTIVIFSSDNGPESSWKERKKKYNHNSSGILKDGKRSLYEGGHRVPFAIRWPAKIKPGRTWDKPVSQIDYIATLGELVGAKTPNIHAEDSQSFLDVMLNEKSNFEHIPLIASNNKTGQFAITEGDWKLVLSYCSSTKKALYNLTNDISEKKNIIEKHPDIAKKLEIKITDIVCNGRLTKGPKLSNDTGHWAAVSWISPEEYKKRHPKGKQIITASKSKKKKRK